VRVYELKRRHTHSPTRRDCVRVRAHDCSFSKWCARSITQETILYCDRCFFLKLLYPCYKLSHMKNYLFCSRVVSFFLRAASTIYCQILEILIFNIFSFIEALFFLNRGTKLETYQVLFNNLSWLFSFFTRFQTTRDNRSFFLTTQRILDGINFYMHTKTTFLFDKHLPSSV